MSRRFWVTAGATARHTAARAITVASFLAFSLAAVASVLPSSTALAATGINKQISFQGKVVNSNGTNVANGSYSFVFSIYTVSSAGSSIWTETKSLTVTDGVFQTNLGSTTSLPGSVDFNTDNIYLGINFNSDGEMTPRIQFTAAAYAFNSDKLGGIAASGFAQLSPSIAQTGTLNVTGTINGATISGGTLSGSTLSASSLTFSAASGASIQAAANQNLTISTVTSGTLALASAGAVNITGAANSTFDVGSGNTLSLQTTNNGPITTGTGLLTEGGNFTFSGTSARTITGPTTGGLTITDASGNLTLSTTTSGNIAANSAGTIALSGTNFGLTSAGVLTLAGNQTSDITTTAAGTATQISIQPGSSSTNSATGANLLLKAGNETGTTSTGGSITIDAGTGTTNGLVNVGTGSAITTNVGRAGGQLTLNGNQNSTFSATNGVNSTTLAFANPTSGGALTLTLPANIGGTLCTTTTCATGGSGSYIQNGTSLQSGANFNISGIGVAATSLQAPLFETTDVASGTSSNVVFQSGNGTAGTAGSGSVTVDSGSKSTTGTTGAVNLGTTNASAVNIGRTAGASALSVIGNGASSATTILDIRVAADTNARFTVGANGKLSFGPGAAATDSTISRSAVKTLTVAANLVVTGGNASTTVLTSNTNTANQIGFVVQGVASQTGDLIELQDNNGNVNAAFNAAGNQLTLGNNTASGTTQGKLLLSDGTADARTTTLQTATTTVGSQTITIPDTAGAGGTICLQSSASCGFATGTSASYIQNQNAGTQASSNFIISGSGTAVTSFLAPTFDTQSGTTTLAIGTTNATAGINLNQNTSVTGTKTFNVAGGNATFGANVGINNASAPNKLSVNTLTTADATAQVAISTGANGNKGLVIQGVAGQSGNDFLFSAQDSAGNAQLKVDLNGNTYSRNAFSITTTSVTDGKFGKSQTVGTGGVSLNDVVILANDGGNDRVLDTTNVRDTRVYGIAGGTAASGSFLVIIISGNYQVTATTGAVAIGDQLVTSATSGQVQVDNNATSGILGVATTAKGAGASGLVGVAVGAVRGQTNPDFGSGNLTTTGTISSGLINGQTISSTANFTGTVTAASTIQGTSIDGTTGLNTGAAGGTQRVDSTGNLVNIGNITTTGASTLSTGANTLTVTSSDFNVTSAGAVTAISTIQGTSVDGTTGINTGAAGGTQRIDNTGNLVNIGNITTLAASTISTGANTLTVTSSNVNVTSAGALTLGASAGTGALTNNGFTVNTVYNMANLVTGGWDAGGAAATVDKYTYIAAGQTTTLQTLTVPNPTSNTVYGRVIYLTNTGTASFTLLNSTLGSGSTATLVWALVNGTAKWTFAGSDGSGILNQNTADQTADFRVTGTGRANTSFTSPLFDSITGGLNIGTGTATGITIGGATTTGTISVGNGAASTINIGTAGGAHTIGIGTDSATAQGITIGSTNAGSTTAIQAPIVTIGAAGASILKNNGATFNNPCAYTGVTGAVTLNTAGKTPDVCTVINITDTGAATITVPAPAAGAGSVVYITNNANSTTPISLLSTSVSVGSTATLVYSAGTVFGWTFAGSDASGLQTAYNNSAATDPQIQLSNTNGGLKIRDATSSTIGNLLQVSDSAGTNVYFSVTSAASNLTGNLTFTKEAARTIQITDSTTAAAAGGQLTVKAAAGNTSGTGGNLVLVAGAGGSSGVGGIASLTGGAAGGGNTNGGAATVQGGAAAGTGTGGSVTLTGGLAASTAGSLGGSVTITGGAGTATGTGAVGSAVTITGGAAGGSGNNNGGSVTTTGGTATGAGTGGVVTLQGGAASATAGSAGGGIAVNGANGTATGTGGVGGNITLVAGSGAGSGNNNGGSITLTAGAATGSGIPGVVSIDTPVFTASSLQTYAVDTTVATSLIDSNSTLLLTVSATGKTISIPAPTNNAVGRTIYITVAAGSQDFTLTPSGASSLNMKANSTATLIYNGSAWTASAAATSLQQVYNNTSASPASIITTSTTKNLLFQAGASFDNSALLQVANSNGANMISVDTTNTATGLNLMPNSGAETASGFTTTFPATGFGANTTVSQDLTAGEFVAGTASVKAVITSGTTNNGIRANLGAALAISTVYNISFSIKTTTTWTGDIDVRYNRTGTTSDGAPATCSTSNVSAASSFSTRTIPTTNFAKISCYITTSATVGDATANIVIFQQVSAARTFFVDNLATVAQNSTGTQDTGALVVGGAAGQGLTLFTLDSYANTPWTSAGNTGLFGSMYYDTSVGLIKCYQASGWGTCGAAPNNNVFMIPEYGNAVLNGSGSNNTGTMTANLCSGTSRLSINTAVCAATDDYNYYQWTSTQATAQTYDIFVRYQLPPTFNNFLDDNTIKMTARTSNTTDGAVTIALYLPSGTQCGSTTNLTSGGANAWAQLSLGGGGETACGFQAGDIMTFKVDMSAKNNANVYASNIQFTMTGK